MNFKTIINFIGEQAVPNYVPVKWAIEQLGVKNVISLFSGRTQKVNDRLNRIYREKFRVNVDGQEISPYDISHIESKLDEILPDIQNPIFNLTGGTKPMTFAGLHVALKRGIPFLYFQSEGGKMVIRMHEVKTGHIKPKEPIEVPEDIYTLEEYLSIHFDNFSLEQRRQSGRFFKETSIGEKIENQIIDGLRAAEIEVLKGVNIPPDIQIDMFVKYGHNVGIIEVKKTLKATAINQIALPSRQVTLGTYIRRIVLGGPPRDETEMKNIISRAELVNVYVIMLKSLKENLLSEDDKGKLVEEVKIWIQDPKFKNFDKMKENLLKEFSK